MEKLRHYVPDALLPAAEAAAADGGAARERTGPLADAYWIKAALAARSAGAPAGDAAAVGTQHATDQDGEVAWLVRVAAAYRTVTPERARQVLAASTAVQEQEQQA